MPERDFAVVIGIGEYEHFRRLNGAVADAIEIAEWFGTVAGFQHVEPVLAPDGDNTRPIQDEIDIAFAKVFKLAGRDAGRLWVYFSGHGSGRAVDHVMLLMANARTDFTFAADAKVYHEVLAKYAHFREQIFLYDCCRSHDGARGLAPSFGADDAAPLGGGYVKQLTWFSSHWQEESFEATIDGRVRGLFTAALLDGLKGRAARLHDDGWVVTAEPLAAYVTQRVCREAEAIGTQTPMLPMPHGGSAIVLSRLDAAPPDAEVHVRARGEESVHVAGTPWTGDVQLDGGEAVFELTPGDYMISSLPTGLRPANGAPLQTWAGERTVLVLR